MVLTITTLALIHKMFHNPLSGGPKYENAKNYFVILLRCDYLIILFLVRVRVGFKCKYEVMYTATVHQIIREHCLADYKMFYCILSY